MSAPTDRLDHPDRPGSSDRPDADLRTDVLILGAGAAGLMAAVAAGESARTAGRRTRVLVVEKNRQAGIKVLVCGGGRGNLTNAGDRAELLAKFGRDGRWLSDAFDRLDNAATCDFFAGLGVPTKTEADGRIFPVSDKARDIVDALVGRADELGVEIVTGYAATELTVHGGRVTGAVLVEADTPVPGASDGKIPAKWRRFDPATWSHTRAQSSAAELAGRRERERLTVSAGAVILAVGGSSYVRMGTTGDGYDMCRRLGVTVVEPRPAVVPLITVEQWGPALAGVAVEDAAVAIDLPKHRKSPSRGDLLFTHFGLSGPAALNLSDVVALLLSQGTSPVPLRLDLVPSQSAEQLDAWLRSAASTDGKKQAKTLLGRSVPERLAECLLAQSGAAAGVTAGQLPREARLRLVESLKGLRVGVHATKGMAQAMVTAGGVPVREVDPRTMESRKVARLYLAGEMLDLTGPSGGYNLQIAWSTGWVAGECAERAVSAAGEGRG
jgi:predicted flavoprotein YhiN